MRALSFFVVVVSLLGTGLIAACAQPPPAPASTRGGDDDEEEEEEEEEGACDVDGDCRGGEVCEGGACARVCSDDVDCAGGQLCQDARCLTPECIDDVDCPGGFFCDDENRCSGIGGCFDGDTRCVDGETVAVCEDGREILDACRRGTSCTGGACVDDTPAEGEGEGVPAEGEGEVVIGEGEGEVVIGEGEGEVVIGEGEGEEPPCRPFCIDQATASQCLFGQAVVRPCAADETCDSGVCVADDACVPDCDGRACGPDPVCNESCGSCTDTCTAAGQCIDDTPAGLARIEVTISPPDAGFDIYLSRAASGSFCDVEDSCFFGNCGEGDDLRPDWDNVASTEGDPLAVFGGGVESASVLTPRAAQNYRVAVHNKRGSSTATVTVNVVVDGVNVFGASKRLAGGDLWSGITARWSGSNVTVSRTDAVAANFSCGGESCTVDTADGNECAAGFTCDEGGFGGLGGAAQCAQCTASSDCAAGDECRSQFCIDDTTDRGLGGSCAEDVDCRDDLGCDGFTCRETCEFICFLVPDSCCLQSGGTCTFDGLCTP